MAMSIPSQDPPDIIQTCCFCQNFYFDMGEPDWSDMTPGHETEISCSKGHWEMKNSDGTDTYRKNIKKAVACPDWKFFQK